MNKNETEIAVGSPALAIEQLPQILLRHDTPAVQKKVHQFYI